MGILSGGDILVLPSSYIFDDFCDQETAKKQAALFLTKNVSLSPSVSVPSPPVAVLGGDCDPSSIGMWQSLAPATVPTIAYGSNAAGLGDATAFPFFLRTSPTASLLVQAMMKFIRTVGWRRIAVIVSPDQFGSDSLEDLRVACVDLGVQILEAISLPLSSTSRSYLYSNSTTTLLTAVVQRVAVSGATVIVIIGSFSWTQPLFPIFYDLGMYGSIIDADTTSTSSSQLLSRNGYVYITSSAGGLLDLPTPALVV